MKMNKYTEVSAVPSKYSFKYITEKTGLLNINTFALGGSQSERHKKFAMFLDSVFIDLKNRNIENLIVNVRQNGGREYREQLQIQTATMD